MVDEGKIDASEVCVFEMTERVGGRLFSLRGLGPDNDLTVDAGGYRTVRERSFLSVSMNGRDLTFLSISPVASIHSYGARPHHGIPRHSHGLL